MVAHAFSLSPWETEAGRWVSPTWSTEKNASSAREESIISLTIQIEKNSLKCLKFFPSSLPPSFLLSLHSCFSFLSLSTYLSIYLLSICLLSIHVCVCVRHGMWVGKRAICGSQFSPSRYRFQDWTQSWGQVFLSTDPPQLVCWTINNRS